MQISSTTPATILDDYAALISGMPLPPGHTVLLCGCVSRHFAYPGANTPPWQLEGAALAFRHLGAAAIRWVVPPEPAMPKVVHTLLRLFHGVGRDPNGYAPILVRHGIGNGVPQALYVPVLLVTLQAQRGGLLGARWWRDYWAVRFGLDPAVFQYVLADATCVIDASNASAPQVRNMIISAQTAEAVDAIARARFGLPDTSAQAGLPDAWAWYRWGEAERAVFESWLRETAWGRLFQRYQR